MAISLIGRLGLECCSSSKGNVEVSRNRNAWTAILCTIELIGYVLSLAFGLKWFLEGHQSKILCLAMIAAPEILLALPLVSLAGVYSVKKIKKAKWFQSEPPAPFYNHRRGYNSDR